jgi:uncharacterized SAM-binding protein YcdF (DUF218 family)
MFGYYYLAHSYYTISMVYKIVRRAVITVIILSLIHVIIFCVIGLRDYVQKSDAIVVFGNTVHQDGTLSDRLTARLNKAVELYQSNYAQTIIVSGALGKEGHNEAEAMRSYLVQQGVRSENILADLHGINTQATAQNSRALMEQHNLRSVILVSQYFHLPRSVYVFKKVGVTPVYRAHADYYELRDLYSLPREIVAFYKYLLLLN